MTSAAHKSAGMGGRHAEGRGFGLATGGRTVWAQSRTAGQARGGDAEGTLTVA
jgi:hypothetical protein